MHGPMNLKFYILFNHAENADIYLRSAICNLLEEGLSNSPISSSRDSYDSKFVGRIPNYVMTNL